MEKGKIPLYLFSESLADESTLLKHEVRKEFQMLKLMLVGWENMKEEDGSDIPFNDKNLKEFMDDTDWIKAVSAAYTESLTGEKVKN